MKSRIVYIAGALLAACWIASAEAYVGPGAGLSAIGSVFAFLGALLLMVVGFIWFPIRRLLRRKGADPAATKRDPHNGVSDNAAGRFGPNETRTRGN